MIMKSTICSISFLFLLLLTTTTIIGVVYGSSSSSGAYKKCSTTELFQCPNCGGIEVNDCFDCDGYFSTDNDHKICFDRRLFQSHNTNEDDHDEHYHYLWNDIVGAIVWFVMAGVATACGVGGGGIYVPLGILLFQFSPKQSSGLSQASIFGASLGGILLNARNKHPIKNIRNEPGIPDNEGRRTVQEKHTNKSDKEYIENGGTFYTRPIIDYDMALFLSPMQMAGAVLGVLIQRILPNWLYLLLAGIVLFITAYKTYIKFFDARKKEKKETEELLKQRQHEQEEIERKGSEDSIESAVKTAHGLDLEDEDDDNDSEENECRQEKSEAEQCIADDGEEEEEEVATHHHTQDIVDPEEAVILRKQYLEEDMRQYPIEKLIALSVLGIGLVILTLLQGGKGVDSLIGITCTSVWYGVLLALQFIWLFGFSVINAFIMLKKQATRVAVQYPFLHDDPIWDFKTLRFYGSFAFIAGVVGGLVGIGGGMVLGPFMMIMGINPAVSSATNASMIILTSSTVAVMFVTSGIVPWSYALFYFFVCFFGAYLGKSKIDGYIKRTGRSSILIFILATIIAFATIGCITIMLLRLAEKDWCFDGFNKFCSNTEGDNDACPVDRFLLLESTSIFSLDYSF